MNALVEVTAASRTHGTVQVLAPTSLCLGAGQGAAVVGANGAGKSTLLRLVAGTDTPTAGTVTVLGLAAVDARLRRRTQVSRLLGAAPTYPDLTVAEHLRLVEVAWGGHHPGPGVDEALAGAHLERVRDQYPGELSSGESQLFALALTLYRPAALVLLDEPEQRLDAVWRDVARRLVLAALDRGRTVLAATHDPGLRDALADRGPVVELAAPAR
ncbi:ABC transporter ATP-binding protein [Isoptericola dokdonensis]|uniref:Arginine transport ATP-binding protein ArtM n=1 Tax=Isoptericola dokdonensis DS-3 TaxID=1300344 RepID=A0A168F450_9MICO|nr:ATP-binding cassette domain-containing protein [Isoptericola dokdonensis]ANC30877.1 Arginine transport ATP-binding protein ArtM [Isoptericola dokdonensis DS-3]